MRIQCVYTSYIFHLTTTFTAQVHNAGIPGIPELILPVRLCIIIVMNECEQIDYDYIRSTMRSSKYIYTHKTGIIISFVTLFSLAF